MEWGEGFAPSTVSHTSSPTPAPADQSPEPKEFLRQLRNATDGYRGAGRPSGDRGERWKGRREGRVCGPEH